MFYALLAIGAVLLLLAVLQPKKKHDFLKEYDKKVISNAGISSQQAVDLKSLTDRTFFDKLKGKYNNIKKQFGTYAEVKLTVLIVALFAASIFINNNFVRENQMVVSLIVIIFGLNFSFKWLQKRECQRFENAFPDALNMMTSAVSSGESIVASIMYVGNTLEGEVGKEFKVMGKRLQLGENIDEVFRKACVRFPYPSFYFFVICIRANMQRGGQLKDIMLRLNRMMFNARAIDKKKFAMTAEARMSVKIVAAIPFFFLFLLQYLSPENYEYVMFNPNGKYILYYVLASEGIGIGIVWSLMKGVG